MGRTHLSLFDLYFEQTRQIRTRLYPALDQTNEEELDLRRMSGSDPSAEVDALEEDRGELEARGM